jgi:hypothetical protein
MIKTARYYKLAEDEKKKKRINPWLAGGLAAATAAGGLAYANHRMDGALVDKAKGWFNGGNQQTQGGSMESNPRGGVPQMSNPDSENVQVPKLQQAPDLSQQIDSQSPTQFAQNTTRNQMRNSLFGNR